MRVLVVIFLAAVVVIFISACEVDDRRCLESHSEIIPITMVNAQGQPYITFIPSEVCDRYEESTP